jgi:hypothetical protein
MIRTIVAALAAFVLVSFGVRADEPAKADAPAAPAADKKMDKAEKKAKKAKKSKKAKKPADTTPAAK